MAEAKTKSKRVTSQSIRENAKKDLSPKWDNHESWSASEFATAFRESMQYYNLNFTSKELKPRIINWMAGNGYTKEQIAEFKATKDWRTSQTMGSIASCLIKGMPAVRADFNDGKNTVKWLRDRIALAIREGAADQPDEDTDTKQAKVTAPVVSIQDRIREQAGSISEDIDYAIDSFIKDPESFNPKAFKIASLLRGKGAKAAQARYIKGFFEKGHKELAEVVAGSAHEQVIEGYEYLSKKNIKKLLEFYEGVLSACDQITAEAKVLKAPRTKKVKPAEELVKKLKFRVSEDKLGITSVPPTQLIGAQLAVVYNVRTRKVGMYIAKDSSGLGVKGTSLINFTDKSSQKTLRKPPEQLKEFKDQNTQKRAEAWFDKNVKTTDTVLNGRMSDDTVILKVFK